MSLLIIVVTIACIVLGYRTRYVSRLIVTRLENGYIIETSEKNIIIIDGGTENDKERLKEIIQTKGNSNVLAWFLTSPQEKNSGALLELMKDTHITISNIYVSLNSKQWYKNSDLEQADLEKIENLMDTLYNDQNRNKVVEMQRRAQYQFDNCIVTPLEVKDENVLNNVILKLDNTFKNVIFLGDTKMETWENEIKERNQDVSDYDSIQTYTEITQNKEMKLEIW